MATIYEMALKLGAQLGADFSGTFNTAQKKLAETQKEIQALGKVQGNISSYQKQEAAMAKCLKAQEQYKAQIGNIKNELQTLTKENGQHGAGTSELANKILDLEKKLASARAEEERHRESLKNLGSALKEVGINTKDLGDESKRLEEDIKNLREEQDNAAESADQLGDKSSNSFKAAGEALAAAGIIAALKEGYDLIAGLTTGAASYADNIGTASVQYSIAAEDLQAFYYAAELVDVSAETLTSTMSRNIRAMSSAKDGTESYVEAYDKLGIKVTDADGQLRDSETVYWEIIDALGAMENETERDAIAIELLGRSAQQINTLVEAGSGVIKEYAAEAKNAGYIMSDKTLAACMALDDEIQRQESNMTALKNTIGGELAPAYTNLKKLQNELITTTTNLAAEHPGLVKGVLASVGTFGTATAGLVAYAGIVTKVIPLLKTLKATMTTAIPAAGPILAVTAAVAGLVGITVAAIDANNEQIDVMDRLTYASQQQQQELEALQQQREELGKITRENAVEVLELENQISELQKSYGKGETLGEFLANVDENIKSGKEAVDSYNKVTDSIYEQENAALGLIDELSRLANQSEITASTEASMRKMIDYLNESVSDLGLTYEDVISDDFDFSEIYSKAVDEWANQKLFKESLEASVKLRIELTNQENDLKTLYEEMKIAEGIRDTAYDVHREADGYGMGAGKSGFGMILDELFPSKEKKAYEAAKKTYDDLKKSHDELAETVKTTSDEYDKAIAVIKDYYGTQGENVTVISEAIDQIEALGAAYAETYKEIYDAAYESITGQYALWENAATVAPKSIDDINNALVTQTAYWSDYNKDMSELLDRGEDIEGLADVIASFADGSEESVNAIAGMAAASDDDLRLMVENHTKMKEQQDEATKSLVEATSAELAEIEKNMIETIENLDLSYEAEAAGRSTIDAYVDALKDGTGDAIIYLNRLAQALALKDEPLKPSDDPKSRRTELAYASGTRNARSGMALVGEYGPELMFLNGGEVIYNALETERTLRTLLNNATTPKTSISFAPELLQFAAVPTGDAYGVPGNRYEISISPTFYLTSEDNTPEKLEEYSGIVADMVLDRLNEIGIDAKRGAFK